MYHFLFFFILHLPLRYNLYFINENGFEESHQGLVKLKVLVGLNGNMPVKSQEMTKVLPHLKCTYHRVRLGGGGNRVVGCGYNSFAPTNPMADTVKCSITVTTDGTEHCACTAMHNVLLKWDP